MNQPGQIPDTVKGDTARSIYQRANDVRREIKSIAQTANDLRRKLAFDPQARAEIENGDNAHGEATANATLAFRHLEDASMRLGKVLQAIDGGVSVYDRSTTVGAPGGTEVPVKNVAELAPSRID